MSNFWLQALTAIVGGGILGAYLLSRRYPWLKYDWGVVCDTARGAMKTAKLLRRNAMVVDVLEEQVEKIPDKAFIIYQDNVYTYRFMDRQMNKAARVGKQMGLKTADTVAVLIHNEPAFLWTVFGRQAEFRGCLPPLPFNSLPIPFFWRQAESSSHH